MLKFPRKEEGKMEKEAERRGKERKGGRRGIGKEEGEQGKGIEWGGLLGKEKEFFKKR